MISESHYWKRPLLRTATWLERWRLDENVSERDLARIERELFVGFYAIRKLLETFKVSPSTRQRTYLLVWSPGIGTADYMNWHRLDEHFDLDDLHEERHDLMFLCNQFIHSFIFLPTIDEDGALGGVYIASDRIKKYKLYFIDIAQIVDAFRTVGRDYPTRLHLRRNDSTQQWEEVDSQ
ncbi:TPA: hypothetical protein QDB01_001892 [Burkholderia vietnamiensis]|nr:hypothetical protein [Burkholderia vietnamiensis]